MSSPFKLHLHRWVERTGVNFTMAIIAHQVALQAEAAFQSLQMLRVGDIEAKLPKPPPIDQWLGFYTNHDAVTRGVADNVPFFDMPGKEFIEMLDGFRKVDRFARGHREKMKAAFEREIKRNGIRQWRLASQKAGLEGQARYKDHLEDVQEVLKNEGKVDEEAEKFGVALRKSPELFFFARVVLPCIGIYRTYPVALLRYAGPVRDHPRQSESYKRDRHKARAKAVEQLVRLDPQLVHHPTIMEWAEDFPGKSRLKHRRKVLQWASEGLDYGRFTALQWKESMGGFVAAWSEVLQQVFYGPYFMNVRKVVLNAPQVFELFNAAARDRSKRKTDDIKDKDLRKISVASYGSAIRDHRRLWRRLIRFKGFFDPPAEGDQAAKDSHGRKSV